MAPATLAGATSRAVRARAGWDRDSIVNAIQEWVATYGEPPRAADWNPSAAKWSGQLWRVARYRAGRADGSSWPALNSAKRPFGGSLNEAIRAAGFEPATPGPKRRRDVDPEQASRAVISPEGRAMIAAALARAREAERARERAERLAARKPKVVRERVVDDAALARARAELATARVDRAEARTAAERLAAKLERAEATVNTLRAERRELKAERDRLVAATERAAAERAATIERDGRLAPGAERDERAVVRALEAELARAREAVAAARAEAAARPRVVTVREPAPEAAVVREALAAAAAAERRAAAAERELRETVAAVKGERRRLTAAELAELRAAGPSGPAVMAGALKALAKARAGGGTTELRAALTEVAQAAVTWQERI
jgi:hypothetical protein